MLEQTNMSVNINKFVATVVNWQWNSFPPWNISYFFALFFLSRNWRFPLSPVKNPGSQNTIVCIIRIKFDFIIVIIITIHNPIIVITIQSLSSSSTWSPCHREAKTATLARLLAGGLCCFVWLVDCCQPSHELKRAVLNSNTNADPSYVHNVCI